MSIPFDDALAAVAPVVAALEQLGVLYHIGGSVASSAYGLPRSSADVDLVAELQPGHVDELVRLLSSDYYVDRTRVLEAIRRQESFNLIHLDTMVKVDVFVPETGEFARQEQARARATVFGRAEETHSFVVKAPEDLVLRKLLWYRMGGEVSERQWSDVVGVLKVQAENLDQAYLSAWATELGITDLLERALLDAAGV